MTEQMNNDLMDAIKKNLNGLVGDQLTELLQDGKQTKKMLEVSEVRGLKMMAEIHKLKDTIELLEGKEQQWHQLEAKEQKLMEQERNLRIMEIRLERDAANEVKELLMNYIKKPETKA